MEWRPFMGLFLSLCAAEPLLHHRSVETKVAEIHAIRRQNLALVLSALLESLLTRIAGQPAPEAPRKGVQQYYAQDDDRERILVLAPVGNKFTLKTLRSTIWNLDIYGYESDSVRTGSTSIRYPGGFCGGRSSSGNWS